MGVHSLLLIFLDKQQNFRTSYAEIYVFMCINLKFCSWLTLKCTNWQKCAVYEKHCIVSTRQNYSISIVKPIRSTIFEFIEFHLPSRARKLTINEPVWRLPDDVCTVLNSQWRTERPSKTCRVKSNKLENSASNWFYYRSILGCTVPWTSDSPIISYVYWTLHHCDSWRIKDQLDVTCYFYFTSYVINMFRTLTYPSSGACDYSVDLSRRIRPVW